MKYSSMIKITTKNKKIFLILVFFGIFSASLFLGTLNPQSRASAQQATPTPGVNYIKMRAWPAFQGVFKYGEWLPIFVELENNGPDQQAELHVRITSSGNPLNYVLPVSLPRTSRKQVVIYITPNTFSRQVNVQLVSRNNLLAQRFVSLKPQPNVNYIVGLVAPERGPLSLINTVQFPGKERPVELVDLPLEEIPERYEGLRSLDLIVFNDTDTSELSSKQTAALETWISRGGRLVVGGGANAKLNLAGLPQNLIQLKVNSDITLPQLDGLENFVQPTGNDYPLRVPGPFLAATGQAQNAITLAKQDNTPLVLEWSYGNGYVNYIALNLTGSPFDAWSGTGPFWTSLISPSSEYPEQLASDVSNRQNIASNMPYALSNLPMLDLPPTGGLALLLGLYVLIIGPLNYIILRWQKRLNLAWVTIPSITIIFSLAAFGLGYALHGSDLFINKITVIYAEPSGNAHANSYIGLFSPSRRSYDIQVSGNGLLSPLYPTYDPWARSNSGFGSGDVDLLQGDPAMLRGLSVDQWAMGSFMFEGMQFELGGFDIDLTLEDDQLVGKMQNTSMYELKDAALVLGNQVQKLGDLHIGKSTNLFLDISGLSQPFDYSPISYQLIGDNLSTLQDAESRQAEVRRQVLESVFERRLPYVSSLIASSGRTQQEQSTPVLLGWLDQAPPEVSIEGSKSGEQTTALVIFPLSYDLPSSGTLHLPPGLITGKIVKTPIDGGACGAPGSTAVYLARGTAVIEFNLPPQFQDVEVDNLLVSIQTDGSFDAPDVFIHNWQSDTEREIEIISPGETLIPQANGLVSSEGSIQLSLKSDTGSGTCYYMAMGLEGHR
jgi:hypothetical protein